MSKVSILNLSELWSILKTLYLRKLPYLLVIAYIYKSIVVIYKHRVFIRLATGNI